MIFLFFRKYGTSNQLLQLAFGWIESPKWFVYFISWASFKVRNAYKRWSYL